MESHENPELAEVLERCRCGDELAWEALVRQFQSRVYGIAIYYIGDPEDARDLAQEIFIRVYRHLELCVDSRMFLPWLICISRNACIDHIRRKKARFWTANVPADDMLKLPAAGPNPEEQWVSNSRRRSIYRALRNLTARNREVIILREILGLSLEEIAGLLSVPLGTVKSRINRARIELAQNVMAPGVQSGGCE